MLCESAALALLDKTECFANIAVRNNLVNLKFSCNIRKEYNASTTIQTTYRTNWSSGANMNLSLVLSLFSPPFHALVMFHPISFKVHFNKWKCLVKYYFHTFYIAGIIHYIKCFFIFFLFSCSCMHFKNHDFKFIFNSISNE